jgi:hypothetical protein
MGPEVKKERLERRRLAGVVSARKKVDPSKGRKLQILEAPKSLNSH